MLANLDVFTSVILIARVSVEISCFDGSFLANADAAELSLSFFVIGFDKFERPFAVALSRDVSANPTV